MNNNNNNKVCKTCQKAKSEEHFNRVVKRETHSPDADENGFEYFLKPCLNCLDCRDRLTRNQKAYQQRLKAGA